MRPLETWLRQQAEVIVKRGVAVEEEMARLSAQAVEKFHREKEGLVALTRAVMDGAAQGAALAAPEQGESLLRQALDGLGRGLKTSAQAAQLTLEESRASGAKYAREDLEKLASDFQALNEMFEEMVHRGTQSFRAHLAAQAQSVRDHARSTLSQVKPAFQSAIEAARRDPVGLGKEAVRTGAAAARQATGVLFTEIGKRLQDTGDKLSRGRET